MAEPTTAWGREAVEDIREIKSDVADLKRDMAEVRGDVSSLRTEFAEFRGKVDGLREEFVVFRAEVRALIGVARLAFTVFGLAIVAGALGVAIAVARLSVQVEGNIELLRESIRATTASAAPVEAGD